MRNPSASVETMTKPWQLPRADAPVVEIHDPHLTAHQVRLLIRREDQLHPQVSGNKWRKLKYNLLAAQAQGAQRLLSFGGAYSNHIHALAAAGHALGLETIGVIRGEAHAQLNPTLRDAEAWGMRLHYVSREQYRAKRDAAFIASLEAQFGPFYLLPEGGSNTLACEGVAEIVDELAEEGVAYDYLCCACGTGATLAGLIQGLQRRAHQAKALGVAVLKGGDYLSQEVTQLLAANEGGATSSAWQIESDYHHGGYARLTPELVQFMDRFSQQQGIALEPIYTGKLIYALYTMVEAGRFPPGTTLLALHSGGLQGNRGMAAAMARLRGQTK